VRLGHLRDRRVGGGDDADDLGQRRRASSGPPNARGTVIPSRPLASSTASASQGTAPERSRSIAPGAIASATAWAASTASWWLCSTGTGRRYATAGATGSA
jgi:hypothetical protein